MNTKTIVISNSSAVTELLIKQKSMCAYSAFLTYVEQLMPYISDVEIMIFSNDLPCYTTILQIDDNVIFTKKNISKLIVYFDKNTYRYRIKNGLCIYDFTFVDDQFEKNRQVLEIGFALQILKYKGATKDELQPLMDRFEMLTLDDNFNECLE